MDVRQVGDNFGGYGPLGGMGYGTGYSSACSLGVGGLVLLFIFLIIIAWAVHSGHDRTREHIVNGNALALAGRQETNALAIAFAKSEGRSETLQSIILNKVDGNGERLCNLAREVDNVGNRVINHGEVFGFQTFSRERCRCGDEDRGRGGPTIDFNSGVQTLTALGSVLGRGNQGAGS